MGVCSMWTCVRNVACWCYMPGTLCALNTSVRRPGLRVCLESKGGGGLCMVVCVGITL